MEKSQSIVNIAKSLIEFSAKITKIKKDATNPFLGKKYASLSNILDQVSGPLRECGLALVQMPSGEAGLTSILMHAETGEFFQDTCEIKNLKEDAQLRGSHITYLRRYGICSILCLNIDDEGGSVEGQQAGKQQQGNQLPWLNKGEMFDTALGEWLLGNTDYETIKSKFKVSKNTEKELKDGYAAGMKTKIAGTKSVAELTTLFGVHKKEIEANKELLDACGTHKASFNKKA